MLVENRPANCTTCGAGPWHGRESSQVDRYTKEVVTECIWVCGRCGSQFMSGEVSRRPSDEKQKE